VGEKVLALLTQDDYSEPIVHIGRSNHLSGGGAGRGNREVRSSKVKHLLII